MKAQVFSKTGSKKDVDINLNKDIFGLTVNEQLLSRAYNVYLANLRSAQPQVKTRGKVSGGGKKPWRQKGTGRARVGSNRVPNWRGGGVVFGPTGNENYKVKLPLRIKRLAIKQALSSRFQDNAIIILEDFINEGIKVKPVIQLFKKIGIKGKILLIVDQKTPQLELSTRNIVELELVAAKYLTIFMILNADKIVITSKALTVIEQWLGGKK